MILNFRANIVAVTHCEYDIEGEQEEEYDDAELYDEEEEDDEDDDDLYLEDDGYDYEDDEDEYFEVEKRKYKDDKLDEGGTDPSIILNHPVAIQARQMSHLLRRQDVVASK